ncbi:uncharacterized protein LOC134790309 [Cydia splendana]|uniref:uncharacterized protein LOC134790309 n=1 Tax=Cydia splendana TaxID=1100963 RepID=UPI002133F845
MASGNLQDIKIEHKRRHTQGPAQIEARIPKVSTRSQPELYDVHSSEKKSRSDFVYVNSAYVGSVDDVNQPRLSAPPTCVVREQYWACSRWPYGQRILAISVGLLLGTVIGLTVIVILRGMDKEIGPGFLVRQSVPD